MGSLVYEEVFYNAAMQFHNQPLLTCVKDTCLGHSLCDHCFCCLLATPDQGSSFFRCLQHIPTKHELAITSARALNQQIVEWKWIPALLYIL